MSQNREKDMSLIIAHHFFDPWLVPHQTMSWMCQRGRMKSDTNAVFDRVYLFGTNYRGSKVTEILAGGGMFSD